MADDIKLNGHHRVTVEKIFQHPVSHNIQWHDVISLLESVGQVSEGHDGRYKVTLGAETETLERPSGHDVNEQMVIDLRRMLKGAGVTSG
jgi:hypothetical protein